MTHKLTLIVLSMLLACAGGVRADALADMKVALKRATAQTPVKASIDARFWRRSGDPKDTDEERGHADVHIEDGARGLAVS